MSIAQKARFWFVRDIRSAYSLSLLAGILPILPAIFAPELGIDEETEPLLYIVGLALALPWIAFVLVKMIRNINRERSYLAKDRVRKQRGEDIPVRCPMCRHEFAIVTSEIVLEQGYDCPDCGAMLDRASDVIWT